MLSETKTGSTRIEIRGLVKRYHFLPVLDDLTLSIDDGALCILVGANGAGKTTLLRILAGLIRADQGEIKVGGQFINEGSQFRRQLGYVGHQPMFYHDLTAAENLRHYARLYQLTDAAERVQSRIRSVGLLDHQHKPVRTFSRGMQQRLSIARALLHDPNILLFDEPYTGLDQEAAQFLDERLQSLHQPGHTILLAAHRPQRLLSTASHIAWLKKGKIGLHLPVSRLSESPELRNYLQETA